MGLIPIVALCALLDGEPNMSQCVYMDNTSHAFANETACVIEATRMKDHRPYLDEAARQLFAEYGYLGSMGYTLWCIEENEVRAFYENIGVPQDQLGDIPNDA